MKERSGDRGDERRVTFFLRDGKQEYETECTLFENETVVPNAMPPAIRRIGEGAVAQKKSPPVLALKSVKKSDTETLR